jgi:LmbE family N-acetylglucosaminyl deacetylase
MPLRLASVFAHPDDDTYGLSGTYALAGGDLDLTVVVATSGESGLIADPTLATPETLADVREKEEREALAAAATGNVAVRFLRFPDGALADADREQLVRGIVEALRPAAPDVVVTFGPEGITRHPDHVAVHQAATEAFHRLQAESGGDGFRRLLYCALPQAAVDRFREAVRATGADFDGPDGPFGPRGVPEETISLVVDCREVAERKLAALRCHRTQRQEFEAFPEVVRQEMLSHEYFVQAWPPVTDPGGPFLRSLFEDA